MAEINIPNQKSKAGAKRAKKLSTKVDLTPMVDLGFLLITFFIVTTTWSQPKAMPLNMPANGDSSNIANSVVLTLIATANDKIFYYHGNIDEALKDAAYGISNYSSKNGIEEIIEEKQIALDKSYKGGRKEMMVLIKAAPGASYGNVVNLLDEMAIDHVKRYSLI
ncbi:MAG TPA: biopolymer transporter ExbD [Puia sp.]|jgi:biopolymer transport protein ExbD|nr:biopolymer transporter ExbD [Puia sp.]